MQAATPTELRTGGEDEMKMMITASNYKVENFRNPNKEEDDRGSIIETMPRRLTNHKCDT